MATRVHRGCAIQSRTMTYLVRKITRAKWDLPKGFAKGEIPADAISVDLRTKSNALSFWQCASKSPDDIAEVALVLAAASGNVEPMDLVWLPRKTLCADLANEDTLGETPVESLADRHVDISQLDYVRLGKVAEAIAGAIADKHYTRVQRSKMIEIFEKAVREKRVKLSKLDKKIQHALAKRSNIDGPSQ